MLREKKEDKGEAHGEQLRAGDLSSVVAQEKKPTEVVESRCISPEKHAEPTRLAAEHQEGVAKAGIREVSRPDRHGENRGAGEKREQERVEEDRHEDEHEQAPPVAQDLGDLLAGDDPGGGPLGQRSRSRQSVEAGGKAVKEGASKEEAEEIKGKLEAAGAEVELK